MSLNYDLNKIKFSTDKATFQRGVGLYESGKVTEVEEAFGDYTAVVQGTKPYRVSASSRRYKDAHCTCYLGERGTLCKHVVALALHAVMDGNSLKDEEKQQVAEMKCSDKRELLDKDELAAIKKAITESMRYIKSYSGPSKTWFANQDSLQEGCNRLRAIISDLPVNVQSADLLVKLLLRLEKKLMGGVDDSNGIVGGCMSEIVNMLEEYAQIDAECIKAFKPLCGIGITSFNWEDSLVRLYDERGD